MSQQPRAPLAEEEVFTDDEESQEKEKQEDKEEHEAMDEQEDSEEAQKQSQAIGGRDDSEVQKVGEHSGTGSFTTPSSFSSQRTLSGIESLPSDPIESLPPLNIFQLPDNILTNYVVIKVVRADESIFHIVRGYGTGNPPTNVPSRMLGNYTDDLLLDFAVTELSRYPDLDNCSAVGGGRVLVNHMYKHMVVYDMAGAIMEAGRRSKQADILIELLYKEGCQLDTPCTPPEMRDRPYRVLYMGEDGILVDLSIHLEGVQQELPPQFMYNPQMRPRTPPGPDPDDV